MRVEQCGLMWIMLFRIRCDADLYFLRYLTSVGHFYWQYENVRTRRGARMFALRYGPVLIFFSGNPTVRIDAVSLKKNKKIKKNSFNSKVSFVNTLICALRNERNINNRWLLLYDTYCLLFSVFGLWD